MKPEACFSAAWLLLLRWAFNRAGCERLVIAPDCGMKYLPREVAVGKLRAMVAGRDLVRAEGL